MEKYIVTEVAVQLGQFNQGRAFGLLLSDQLETCGYGGSQHTETFDTVNRLGADLEGKYFVNFLGPGKDLEKFEGAVKEFLDEFMRDMKNNVHIEDFLAVLAENDEEEEMPEVKGYEILITRKYQD